VFLGKEHGIPVVISEHSSVFLRGRLSRRDLLKARFAFGRADAVLPVGAELETALRALGVATRLEAVPNTIDTRVFRPGPGWTAAPGGRKKILLPALLREGKGIPGLFRALAELRNRRRDFVLEIAGDGPKREEYRRLAETLGLAKAVKFSGMKNREELAGLMREAVFIVQPSIVETFGMTVIEALASGKPVVAMRIPAFERTITQRQGILVPPGDTAALAAALDHMLDRAGDYRPELLARYTEENFGYRAVGERLNAVYASVRSGRPGRISGFTAPG